jgi:hypothetical protein
MALLIEDFTACGTRCGTAMRQRDHSRFVHERDYYRQMLCLVPEADRQPMRDAYDAAYRLANPVGKPCYFR